MIKLFQKQNGIKPVEVFFNKLIDDGQLTLYDKASAYIANLDKHGLSLKEPYIKYLGNEIYELRPSRVRIFFIKDRDDFILLNAFIKKTNKTPMSELFIARKYYKSYLERIRNEEKEIC